MRNNPRLQEYKSNPQQVYHQRTNMNDTRFLLIVNLKMLLLGCLLIPVILAASNGEIINNYLVQIRNNNLISVEERNESSTELDLSGRGLIAIDQKAFDGLSNLQNLSLANNSLSRPPQLVFLSLANLTHLSLASNKLTYFEYSFVGLEKLQLLNLLNNDLVHHWTSRTFLGLDNSTTILTDDPIGPSLREESSVPLILLCSHEGNVSSVKVMRNVENLRDEAKNCGRADLVDIIDGTLNLYERGIKGFANGWYNLEDLTIHSLNLGNNKIARVTSEILNDLPQNLTNVDLHENFIKILKKGIIINENLCHLNFDSNLMREIEDGALLNTNLTSIGLYHNELVNISFVVTLPSTLEKIYLGHNHIKELSSVTFSRFKNLVHLDLNSNNITEIKRDLLGGLSSLKEFYLESNHVNKIEPGSFRDLKALIDLNLKENNLTTLDKGVFDGLVKVHKVNLAENQLKIITNETLRGLSDNMAVLDLRNNQIGKLEKRAFVNSPTLELYLDHNPITEIEVGSFNLTETEKVTLDSNVVAILNKDNIVGLPIESVVWFRTRNKRI